MDLGSEEAKEGRCMEDVEKEGRFQKRIVWDLEKSKDSGYLNFCAIRCSSLDGATMPRVRHGFRLCPLAAHCPRPVFLPFIYLFFYLFVV